MKNKTSYLALACMVLPWLSMAQSFASNEQNLAAALGWVESHDPANLCRGYFSQPVLLAPGQIIQAPKQSTTQLQAGQVSLSPKGVTKLSGGVLITQPGRRLEAQQARVERDNKTGQFTRVQLQGGVKAYTPGKLLISQKAQLSLQNQSGHLFDVLYRLLLIPQAHLPVLGRTTKLPGLTAWGRAKSVQQSKPGYMTLHQVSYSTCHPQAPFWQLHAKSIHINRASGKGKARDVTLTVANIPILHSPYLSFPVSQRRKSGFLFPTFGHTSQSGWQLGIPFYWNIAPNYDVTLKPTLYSKRGILFRNVFRYLFPTLSGTSTGSIGFDFIANDRAFRDFQSQAQQQYPQAFGLKDLLDSSTSRYLVTVKNQTVFNKHWSAMIDFAQISDDYFLQDFGQISEQISENQLLQQAAIEYRDQHWVFKGLVQGYQTLHPVNRQPVVNAYSRLPQLSLNGYFPNTYHGLSFSLQSQASYFTREWSPSTLDADGSNVNGGRFHLRPGVSLPIQRSWGYFTPQLQLDAVHYSLQNQGENRPNTYTRTLPILSIHSGLNFDRSVWLHQQSYRQTLEPEVFYLWVPYRNQQALPNFDTAVVPFDYSQLFVDNRFSGIDRLGDANQLSVALTSRLIAQETGDEKLRLSVGQIYYFKHRQVQVCGKKNCSDFFSGMGTTPSNASMSPIATLASYHILPHWHLNGGWAWDPASKQTITSSIYLNYNLGPTKIFNIGYSFLRNGDLVNTQPKGSAKNHLHQLNINGTWPISHHWNAIGVLNYNIGQHHPQTYLAGLEYNSCCVRLRFVGGRVFSHLNQLGKFKTHQAFYLQIQLKGLASIGTNSISQLLTSQINGFQDPFRSSGVNPIRT